MTVTFEERSDKNDLIFHIPILMRKLRNAKEGINPQKWVFSPPAKMKPSWRAGKIAPAAFLRNCNFDPAVRDAVFWWDQF